MLILSKYKDYYDYLKGIYGEDNKLILDRREGTYVSPSISPYNDYGVWRLYIAGRILEFIDMKGIFIFGDSIAPHSQEVHSYFNDKHVRYLIKRSKTSRQTDKIFYPTLSKDIHNIYKFKEIPYPIFLFSIDWDNKPKIDAKFPRLTDMNINKVISAHDMWLMLSQWLAEQLTKNEPSVPIGDDKIRIQSHGFDLKDSFRNTKNRMI